MHMISFMHQKINYLLCLLVVFIGSHHAFAQANEYIQTYHDQILLKGSLNNRSLNFNISPRRTLGTETASLLYRPNVQNTFGLSAHFKHVGLGVRFKLSPHPSAKEQNKRNGNTDYFDLQFHSYGRKIGYDIYYQRYKGYFISDPDDIFNSSLNGARLPRRDDLRLQNFNINFFLNFNPDKFSYRSSFIHDEQQLKSAGSFILTGSIGYFRAAADSSFIPTNAKFGFHPESLFSKTEFYTLSVTPGYAHTFVLFKRCYFSASLSALVGLQYYEAGSKKFYDEGFDHYFKGILRTSAGYNGKKWAFGMILSSDVQNLNTDFIQYQTVNLDVSLFVAHRIKTNFLKDHNSFLDILKRKKKA